MIGHGHKSGQEMHALNSFPLVSRGEHRYDNKLTNTKHKSLFIMKASLPSLVLMAISTVLMSSTKSSNNFREVSVVKETCTFHDKLLVNTFNILRCHY